jgi:RNA polymerase sigma factor (sigma-70 family)
MTATASSARIDVIKHAGLIGSIIKRHKYARPGVRGSLDLDDLTQSAFLGLLRAASDHDPKRGAFTTYGSVWARSFIGRAIANQASVVRTPVFLQDRRAQQGERRRAEESSLDAPLKDAEGRKRLDFLTDPDAAQPDDEAQAAERRRALAKIFAAARLSRRLKRVLVLRFVDELSQAEAGAELGLSRSRTGQLEAEALERLRGAAKRLGLEEL